MENQTDVTASADFKDVRGAVEHWNERLARFREKFGPAAKPDTENYVYHPAHADLENLYRSVFIGCSADNSEAWACDLLSKLSRDGNGGLLVDGRGREYAIQLIDWAEDAADRAAAQGRIAECGMSSCMAVLWRALERHLWGFDPDDTLTIAIREAAL